MMKTLFFMLVLMITGDLVAQNKFEEFDLLSLNAYRAKEQNNFKEAVQYYKLAFNYTGLANAPDYINATTCAIGLNDIKMAWNFIIKGITQTGISLETLTSHAEIKDITSLQELIEKKYDSLYKVYYQNIPNLTAYQMIEKLMARDQFVRKLDDYYFGITDDMKSEAIPLYIEAQKKKDTVAIKKYRAIVFPKLEEDLEQYNLTMMRTIDSLNISELINITREHGWQKNAWFILWHQRGSYGEDSPSWNFFKTAIDKEIAEGKLPQSFWAPFEDYKSISTNGVSVYGYHPGKVDPESVNKNRESIGLPALTNEEIKARNENPRIGRMF